MMKTHDILKRISMLMLSGIVALTTCVTSPFLASAQTYVERDEDLYYLDLGLTICEKMNASGSWLDGNVWQSTESKPQTITFGKDADVVSMELADGDGIKFFSRTTSLPDGFITNLPLNLAGTKDKFEDNYRDHCAINIAAGGSMSGTNVTLQNTTTLNTKSQFEVCKQTRDHGAAYVRDFIYSRVGNQTDFAANQPKLYASIEAAIENCNTEGRVCYIVFKPTLIHIVLHKRISFADGNIEARLTAPTKVKVGQSLTVSDATIVASDTRYESGTLSRKVGSGSYTTLATWQGPGRNGENSGQSLTETFSEVGTVTYRLDVRANSGKTSTYETSVVIESAESKDYGMDFGWSVYPTTTYEGHPVMVADTSDFSETTTKIEDGVEKTETKWYDIYSRGSHSYETTATDFTQTRIDKGNTEFRFWAEGNYSITVEEHFHGLYDGATENVKVLKTPTIIDSLSGQQKQNRKQVLSADIALNPRYPLVDWEMIIKDEGTGETVTLNPSRTKVNSTNIKTREVSVTTDVDGCFSHIKVEFLTKNPKEGQGANVDGTQPYSYSIFVKDSRGRTERVNKNFSVAPDKAPVAVIETEESFIREQGSNTASISVKDVSSTDGDNYERYWSYAEENPKTAVFGAYTNITTDSPGFKDKSFGSLQNISFNKEGVGKVNVKLHVKDIIPEDQTLIEYIVPSDYLEGNTTKQTTVVNVAPKVSLDPIETVNGQVYVYSGLNVDLGAFNSVVNDIKNLKTELLSDYIFMDVEGIKGENITGTAGRKNLDFFTGEEILYLDYEDGRLLKTQFSPDYGYWYDQYYTGDEDTLYVLNPNWTDLTGSTRNCYGYYYVQFPFTISAYDLRNGNVKWNIIVTQDMWGTSSIVAGGPVPYFDSEYLLLRTGDGTLLFQKSNGAFIKSIPFVMGDYVWEKGDSLYTYKSDGIYAVSLETGKVRTVYSGTLLENPRLLGGKVWFLDANTNLKLVRFDLSTETASREIFKENYILSNIRCIGIDSECKIAISDGTKIYVYRDLEEPPVYTSPVISNGYGGYSNIFTPFVVHNSKDVIEYVGYGTASQSWDGGTGYTVRTCYIYNISNGEVCGEWNARSSGGYDASFHESGHVPNFYRLLEAWDYGNGIIDVATGYAEYNNGYKDFYIPIVRPLASTIRFNMFNKTASWSSSPFNTSNVETAGRNMGTYYICSQNNNDFEQTDGTRNLVVRTLPKSSDEISEISIAENIKEKEPAKSDKALFIALENLGSEAKEKLANVGYSLVEGASNIKNRVKEYFKAKGSKVNSICVTKSGTAKATLSRDIRLEPSKEYFYDYTILDSEKNAADTGITVSGSMKSHKDKDGCYYLNTEQGYTVTSSVEEYYTGILNPFFSYSIGQREAGIGYNLGTGGNISFIVPEGKEAVMEIAYTFSNDSYWSDCGVYCTLDGTPWDKGAPLSFKDYNSRVVFYSAVNYEAAGMWTCKPLSEGEHTFSMSAISRGYVSSAYKSQRQHPINANIKINSIKVLYIEKRGGVNAFSNLFASHFGEKGKINRSFSTPPSNLTYAKRNALTFSGNNWSEFTAQFPVLSSSSSSYREGSKKEGYTTWYTTTYTVNMGGEVQNFSIVSSSYTDRNGRSQITFDRISKDYLGNGLYNLTFATMWGQHKDDAPMSYFSGTIYYESVNDSNVASGKAFWNESGQNFVLDKTFDGTSTITLSSTAPTWYLTSFSLYYLENGKKVYVINEEQMGKDKLKNWEVNGGTKSFAVYSAEPVEEDAALIYKKGEYVAQKVNYSDYESDPSKTGYWIYAHQAFNDGPHAKAGIVLNDDEQVIKVGGTSVAPGSLTIEQAAERLRSLGSSSYILTEPINRFYEDGKYHALYYAYDDTSRGVTPGGNPNYDKASNIAEIVFYIIGESSTAPYIKSIKTSPAVVIEDENAKILTEVGDAEGDTLSLTVELFRDSEQILRQKWTGLTPNAAGEYPIKTTNNFTCDAGAYTVIATVRDTTGVGAGTYKFKVGAAGKIEGMVSHTEKWEANRKAYNVAKFGEEGSFISEFSVYAASENPRKRGTNVFWAGEAFCLTADVKGKAQSVTCTMYVDAKPASGKVRKREAASYTATLRSTGRKNEKGEAVYEGRLEDKAFRLLGQTAPEEVRFVFTAVFAGGKKKECEARVIVDNTRPYELMHRIY